jgi:hypothetical protein
MRNHALQLAAPAPSGDETVSQGTRASRTASRAEKIRALRDSRPKKNVASRKALLASLALLVLQPGMAAFALTCADLDGAYVLSQEPSPVYLGFLGSQYASESINNLYGTYGSEYNQLSVRNPYGPYGSPYATYSANNDFTNLPPEIYKWGNLIGYLTTNTIIAGGVSLEAIDLSCIFFASAPRTYPFIPVGLVASDGIYADRIELAWAASAGAAGYGVYYSESQSGNKIFLGTVTTPAAVVTELSPGVTYYFWVSAVNNFGESALSAPDTGYIGIDTDGDGVPDEFDEFPNDPSEWTDSDGDGTGDNGDTFPNDPTEASDSDGDGVGDNADAFPNDPQETADADNDGIGDNGDPDDDNDGTDDVSDAFPLDPTESADSDGDGVGDNADDLPNDPTETVDTDRDGIGNNADTDDDNDGVLDTEDDYPLGRFDDVRPDYWAFRFVEKLARAGITGGCDPTHYCPEKTVSRAQMAVFLERGMRGKSYAPPPASGTVFLDVESGDFAAAWIEQLSLDGITGGCGGNNFCPHQEVSRAQMAVFLLRATHGAAYAPPSPDGAIFNDVDASYWALAWIEQLANEGISSGCGGGNFCPEQAVTRAQMAVFLVRAFAL